MNNTIYCGTKFNETFVSLKRRIINLKDEISTIEECLLEKFNINTRNNGKPRDFYDVLKDISKIYTNLNEDGKTLIKNLILGKNASRDRFEEYMKIEFSSRRCSN